MRVDLVLGDGNLPRLGLDLSIAHKWAQAPGPQAVGYGPSLQSPAQLTAHQKPISVHNYSPGIHKVTS